MGATGYTLETWKTSETVLIDKEKGDETDYTYFKPVGMANTLYEHWTRMLTNTLHEYAEANCLLRTSQAESRKIQYTGFRIS